MTIAEKIYKLRNDFGLSQEAFANKVGTSQSAINYWENGKRQPKTAQLKKIANAFDIALYILMDDDCDLLDVTSEANKNMARFIGDTEMESVPKPFTAPIKNSSLYKESKPLLHTNDGIFNHDCLDDLKFNDIMQKTDRGEELTPQECIFKSAYLERSLRSIGDSFARYYIMLNEEGQKIADEEITRTIKQLELLTKIPEYRKKTN